VATPGAGKTTFALRVAADLLERREVQAFTVVAPTEHLKRQWAEAAHLVGISLDPEFRNAHGAAGRDFTGVAVTYAQVAAHPALHRRRTETRPTLVILDEIHHAGDSRSWGEATREAFAPATRRLALTGYPLSLGRQPDPVRDYAPDGDGTCAASPTTRTATRRRWRRRRAAGDVPRVHRLDALAHPGRRRGAGHAWVSRSPRSSPPRRGGPPSTPRASGSRRSSTPPTAGCPRSGGTFPTPAAW
jgi:hypothetical protein